MRQWLVVQLGTWHTYKQVNTLIWSHWGPRIFAPLFNELIGNANFKRKAKLSTIIKFLTIVRLSYSSFKKTLDVALKTVQDANMDRIAISNLRDLKKLLVFFIPVVSGVNISNITEMSACMSTFLFMIQCLRFDAVILLSHVRMNVHVRCKTMVAHSKWTTERTSWRCNTAY